MYFLNSSILGFSMSQVTQNTKSKSTFSKDNLLQFVLSFTALKLVFMQKTEGMKLLNGRISECMLGRLTCSG